MVPRTEIDHDEEMDWEQIVLESESWHDQCIAQFIDETPSDPSVGVHE